MSTLLSFPGQGAQQVGMLHDFVGDPITQAVLSEASDVLGEDVLQLDTEQALSTTRAVQLCLLIAGVASARKLLAHHHAPEYTAGLSIGAYAAAVVAEAIDFKDALTLVSLRGKLMQEAYPEGYSMTAVQGLSLTEVEQLLIPFREANQEIYLANINADNQHVLAGKNELLESVASLLQQQGMGRASRLSISVPSHCELLAEQAEQLFETFLTVPVKHPRLRYLSGSSARLVTQPDKIRDDLAFNMCRVVNWQGVLESAFERGVRLHIQLAPGAVLANLGKRVIPDAINVCYQSNKLSSLHKLMEEDMSH